MHLKAVNRESSLSLDCRVQHASAPLLLTH